MTTAERSKLAWLINFVLKSTRLPKVRIAMVQAELETMLRDDEAVRKQYGRRTTAH